MRANAYMLATDGKTLGKESHGGEQSSDALLSIFYRPAKINV